MSVSRVNTNQKRPAGLRIAVVIQSLNVLGGKERDALEIAGGLSARGYDVTIVTRSASLKIPPEIGLSVIGSKGWCNHSRARFFATAIGKIRSFGNFDAVLSFEKLKDADVYYAAELCLARRKLGFKSWLPRYVTYRNLERECFGEGGPEILFLCHAQADDYKRHYEIGAHRSAVLPPMIYKSVRNNFYDRRAAVRQSVGIPPDATLAVSVAVYPTQKGVDRTIAALGELPDLHFLNVGLKDGTSVKALAAAQNVNNRCHFLGQSINVAELLDSADIMLHPARTENTGLVILESLLAGVPVITTANCGFSDYITRYGAGIALNEPFNAADYVATIRAALKPDVLAEMKLRARNAAPQLMAEGGLDRIVDHIVESLANNGRIRPTQYVEYSSPMELVALPG